MATGRRIQQDLNLNGRRLHATAKAYPESSSTMLALVTELVLPMVHSQPGGYRTNLGFAQTSSGNFKVLVSIFTWDTVLLAEQKNFRSRRVEAAQQHFRDMGIKEADARRRVDQGSADHQPPSFWTTYAVVIDNTTNDPTYVLPVAP